MFSRLHGSTRDSWLEGAETVDMKIYSATVMLRNEKAIIFAQKQPEFVNVKLFHLIALSTTSVSAFVSESVCQPDQMWNFIAPVRESLQHGQ